MKVFKEFRFEAAHSLPHLPEGHKCRRPHGHSYLVRVTVEGDIDPETGMVVDYALISEKFEKLIFDVLDHRDLNEVEGLEISTSEVLSRWIWKRLRSGLPVTEVLVRETPTAGAVYSGE